jgi:hypothetical protein
MAPEKDFSSSSQNSPASRGLLYVLLSAFAFFSGWSSAKLSAPGQDPSETIPPQDTPTPESRQGEIGSSVGSQIPPPLSLQNQSDMRKDNTPLWEKGAAITIAAGTIGLLVINIFLLRATKQSADAAKNANELTHQVLSGTQGAVFQMLIDFNKPLKKNPWVGPSFMNIGKIPARNFKGVCEFLRVDSKGEIIQSEKQTSTDDTIPVGFAFTCMFPVVPPHKDLSEYRSETFRATATIAYDDGFGSRREQQFCRELEIHPTQGVGWPPCEVAKAWKEHPP